MVRPALPADAQELARLGERLWRETYTGLLPAGNLERHLAATFGPSQQEAELSHPECCTLALEEGGVLLGYALLRAGHPQADSTAVGLAGALEIARFYVDPSRHGTGAAQTLMAAVLAHAASTGRDGVWLQVWEQNLRGLRFYQKVGFTDAGAAAFRVGDQIERDRLLVKRL